MAYKPAPKKNIATITKNKKEYNEYTLTLQGVTAGKILSILHALDDNGTELAKEVVSMLCQGVREAGLPETDMLVQSVQRISPNG